MASKNFRGSLEAVQPLALRRPNPPSRMASHDPNRPRFLFVEADPRALAALRRLARELPGPQLFADCARQACALVKEREPRVVVSGYGLPDGDGLALLECVRARDPRTACALHTAQPPARLRESRGIAWMDRAAPPRQVLALLDALAADVPNGST
ncbi:response regulator [Corallococcus sp. M34]|nr:response regulator [Citreicoccus inhibens]